MKCHRKIGLGFCPVCAPNTSLGVPHITKSIGRNAFWFFHSLGKTEAKTRCFFVCVALNCVPIFFFFFFKKNLTNYKTRLNVRSSRDFVNQRFYNKVITRLYSDSDTHLIFSLKSTFGKKGTNHKK